MGNDISNLAQVLDKYSISQPFSPKKLQKALCGLQSQMDFLKNIGEQVFSKQKEGGQTDWNDQKSQIDEIHSMLKECKNRVLPQKSVYSELINKLTSNGTDEVLKFSPEQMNLVTILKQTKIYCEIKLSELETKLAKANKETNILELLKEEKENLADLEILVSPLFEKVSEKINKLQAQTDDLTLEWTNFSEILSNLTQRIKKSVSKHLISEEINKSSYTERNEKILKKQELEGAFLEALTNLAQLKEAIYRNVIKYTLMPEIKAFQAGLSQKQTYFENLLASFKKIDVNVLASDFDHEYDADKNKTNLKAQEIETDSECLHEIPKPQTSSTRYMRDWANFLTEATTYSTRKENFKTRQAELLELKKKIFEFYETVKENLENLNTKNTKLENGILDLACINKNQIANQLLNKTCLKDDEADKLKKILTEIETNWNQCLWDVNELEHQSEIFSHFKNVTENLSLCFMLGESIYQNLRNNRKSNPNKLEHIESFEFIRKEFRFLTNLIGLISEINENISNELNSKHPSFVKLLNLFKKDSEDRLSFILTTELEQIHNLKLPDSCKIYDKEEKWSKCRSYSIDLESVKDVAKERQETYTNTFLTYQKNVISDFKNALHIICNLIVYEFDMLKQALTHSFDKPHLNNDFTNAFYIKNPVGNACQTGITYVGYGVKKLIPFGQAQNDNIDGPEKYVPDPTPLVNPFDGMKITF
jgi:hypothetical protein